MSTRGEITGERSLAFSAWIRENLPSSNTGFCVTNQDWLFWNYKTKRLMLCEEKTHGADISQWFKWLIREVLHPALVQYCKDSDVTYLGYHLIQFENTTPEDGEIYFDRKLITKKELINVISLRQDNLK